MRLKQKAEEEQALKDKASISIPLVDEHTDDVRTAKKVSFGSDSSQDRRRKRLEIKTQSVFGSSSSSASPSKSDLWRKDREGAKRTRAMLVEACSSSSKKRGMASGLTSGSAGVGKRTKALRNSLGIRTATK